MKIALINLSLDTNYGGNLQRFALYTVLTRMGYDITYIPSLSPNYRPSGIHGILSRLKRAVYKYILRKEILVKGKIPIEKYEADIDREYSLQIPTFLRFTQEHVKCWPVIYYNFKGMKEIVNEFDVFIVGSDQVWKVYSTSQVLHFYLDFIPPTKKKIAYAVSFGNSEQGYTASLIRKSRKLVKEFYAISFREQAGLDIASRFHWKFNKQPQLVLDPTLLLKANDYRQLFKDKSSDATQNLFYYVLDIDNGIKKFIQKVSNELNLESYGIDSLEPNIGETTSILLPSPVAWLQNIVLADFIITDSFHGTLFSIIFNKPFVTIMNSNRGANRYQPLLGKLDLMKRIIRKEDLSSFSIDSLSKIDWNDVNKKVESYRQISLMFLKNALS